MIRVRIHDGRSDDSIVLFGETLEDLRGQAKVESERRGWKDCWSEELTGNRVDEGYEMEMCRFFMWENGKRGCLSNEEHEEPGIDCHEKRDCAAYKPAIRFSVGDGSGR